MPRIYKRLPVEERFWAKVNKETGTECWEFTGCLLNNGYGLFRNTEKKITAHRFSYQLHKGPIPDGMCILHSCDNRKCVNPLHLSIGTNADNMRDMRIKNRQASKLSEFQVKEIREKLNLGIKQKVIAQEYNINKSQISKINTGKHWSHVNV